MQIVIDIPKQTYNFIMNRQYMPVDEDLIVEAVRNGTPLEQEPKIGHWRKVYQGDEIINYRCSECVLGDTNNSTNLYGWDYCRRCGAKMAESEEV